MIIYINVIYYSTLTILIIILLPNVMAADIRSSNRAAHVTLRTAKNVPPRHSNDMLESGNYNELQFGRSVSLSGIVTTEG